MNFFDIQKMNNEVVADEEEYAVFSGDNVFLFAKRSQNEQQACQKETIQSYSV